MTERLADNERPAIDRDAFIDRALEIGVPPVNALNQFRDAGGRCDDDTWMVTWHARRQNREAKS